MTIADLYNALEKAVDSGSDPNDSVLVDCDVFGYMELQRLTCKMVKAADEREKIILLKLKVEK